MPATIQNNNGTTELQAVQLAESERIFVTKIPRDCTEAQLKAYFQKFGNVTDVHMPTVPGRPGHKGIAFVSYDCPKVAESVRTRKEKHSLLNRNIIVDFATTRNPELAAQRKAATQEAKRARRKDGMDEYYEYMMGSSSWKQGNQSWQQQQPQQSQGGCSSGMNSSYDVNTNHGYGNPDTTGNLYDSATGSSYDNASNYNSEHYSAESQPSAAQAPADLHTLQQEKELFEYMYGAATSSGGGLDGRSGATASGAGNHRVFVSKIPQDMSQQEIEEYFSQFGPLADCYMPADGVAAAAGRGGQHRGIAFLTFRDARVGADVLTRSQRGRSPCRRGSSYEVKPGQFVEVAKAHDRAIDNSSTNSNAGGWGHLNNRNSDGGKGVGSGAAASNYRSSPY